MIHTVTQNKGELFDDRKEENKKFMIAKLLLTNVSTLAVSA